jgi:TP901 family phage tail tape measure protein
MVRNPVASEQVQVAVSGDTAGFQNSIRQAAGQLSSFRAAAGGAGAALAALAVAGFAKATKAAASFEEAMVGVEKVTSAETAAQLSEELRGMAETVPIAQEELAGIAEQAGRLGIEGTANIRRFTRVTGEMVTATDLTADQAADAFARLTELTDISTDEVRELGSSINRLSNNMATSSSEIVNSMLRSSAALSSLGVQAEDQLALSASLNEVSENAARAGTRLKRVAQELQDPKKAQDFANALGVSASEFERMRQENPAELIKTLAATLAEGGAAADTLRENFSSASRGALGAFAQNLESIETAQRDVNREFEESTSLTEEFETATDTFNSELQLTKNALRNVGITTGNRTLPALTDLLGGVRGAIEAFGEFNESTDGLAGSLGLATAAIGGTGVALAAFVSGPVGLAAAAIGTLAAAVAADFAGIRSTGIRLAEDLGGTLSRSFSRLSNSALASVGNILPKWYDFERSLSQGIDTIAIGIASMVDAISTGLEIVLQNMRDAGRAAVAVANGEFKKAQEIATETLQDTKEDAGDLLSRLEERGTAGRRRAARRRGGQSGVPGGGESSGGGDGGSPGIPGGGGGSAGGGGAATGAPAGAGAAAATGGTGGGGSGGPGGAPAWTTSLNTTLDSLQSSITELTATSVVADAVADAVDGATLTLRGDLGDLATMDEVEATLRESSRREGRRARDLGAGGGIR